MKAIKAVVSAGALIVIVLSVLVLLFAMPIEFLVSSWHLTRTVETTLGVVNRSEIVGWRNNERSDVEYGYVVGGRSYTSTRKRAGFMGDQAPAGAGEFARSHPVGSMVVVHYDPKEPEFALVEYGWPKWSLGFSLVVWGAFAIALFRNEFAISRAQFLGKALVQSMPWTGIITVAVFAPTLSPAALLQILAIYGGVFLLALAYEVIRKRRRSGVQVGSLAK